jgi:hypothetical protein
MNGQEHYAEAERLIAKARSLGGGETYNSIQVRPQVILERRSSSGAEFLRVTG